MSARELDRWASEMTMRGCNAYVAHLAVEGGQGSSRADAWLKSKAEVLRNSGWVLVGALAMRDDTLPREWFTPHLVTIQKTIHQSPNHEREAMSGALISIGCRDATLRKAALATAKQIGPVTIDHGDTDCKTPDATTYMEKAWANAVAKGFESPAAQERNRESMRTRC